MAPLALLSSAALTACGDISDNAGTSTTANNSSRLIGNTGAWHIEALGQTSFNFGTDGNNAPAQPGAEHHDQRMP